MENEKIEQTDKKGLKRAQNFFLIMVIGSAFALIFDILEEYRDYKEHSDYYVEPYPSLQDHLELSLCFYGVVILICLSVWIVLKIIQRKSK